VSASDHNPFYVLEVATNATPKQVERQKQKLLGMLELGIGSAQTYQTPLGKQERTSELVRQAAHTLEQPLERLLAELWADVPAQVEALKTNEAIPDLHQPLLMHYLLQRAAAKNTRIASAEFDALGLAWDQLFESRDFDKEVEKRSQTTGVDSNKLLNLFQGQIAAELVELLKDAPPFDLDEVESAFALDALELTAQRVCQNTTNAKQIRSSWNALKEQYKELTEGRGDYVRRLSFEILRSDLEHFACDVHAEGFYILSKSLFVWLRDEAQNVGDEETYELQCENVRIAVNAQLNKAKTPDESESEGTSKWLWVVALIILALVRMGRDCDSRSSYENWQPPPDLYQDLERYNIEAPATYDLESLDDVVNQRSLTEEEAVVPSVLPETIRE
jgi:hypothetical protein